MRVHLLDVQEGDLPREGSVDGGWKPSQINITIFNYVSIDQPPRINVFTGVRDMISNVQIDAIEPGCTEL